MFYRQKSFLINKVSSKFLYFSFTRSNKNFARLTKTLQQAQFELAK